VSDDDDVHPDAEEDDRVSSPLVNQFKKGGISRDVRLTAASGALPLTPFDQVELLFLLTRDKDDEVASKASSSLLALSPADLVSVLKDASVPADALAFYGEHVQEEEVLQAIVRNPSTPDETVRRMVPRLSETNLEFVVVNQTRLLRHTPIIDALEANENLGSDQQRRVSELKHDFRIGVVPEAKPAPSAVPAAPSKVDLGMGPAEEDEPPPKSREEAEALYGLRDSKDEELTEEEEKKRKSIFERIYTMSAAEKMMEALKGDRSSRMMLVRDRNRTVWAAVLQSPQTNESDAEAIAQMRNVSPDVLREIGKKREWTKRYKVAHELVKNPKTPPEISSQLLPRMAARDLRALVRDRNVPEMIRRQADKMTKRTG
jgi:hypothetical protein